MDTSNTISSKYDSFFENPTIQDNFLKAVSTIACGCLSAVSLYFAGMILTGSIPFSSPIVFTLAAVSTGTVGCAALFLTAMSATSSLPIWEKLMSRETIAKTISVIAWTSLAALALAFIWLIRSGSIAFAPKLVLGIAAIATIAVVYKYFHDKSEHDTLDQESSGSSSSKSTSKSTTGGFLSGFSKATTPKGATPTGIEKHLVNACYVPSHFIMDTEGNIADSFSGPKIGDFEAAEYIIKILTIAKEEPYFVKNIGVIYDVPMDGRDSYYSFAAILLHNAICDRKFKQQIIQILSDQKWLEPSKDSVQFKDAGNTLTKGQIQKRVIDIFASLKSVDSSHDNQAIAAALRDALIGENAQLITYFLRYIAFRHYQSLSGSSNGNLMAIILNPDAAMDIKIQQILCLALDVQIDRYKINGNINHIEEVIIPEKEKTGPSSASKPAIGHIISYFYANQTNQINLHYMAGCPRFSNQ